MAVVVFPDELGPATITRRILSRLPRISPAIFQIALAYVFLTRGVRRVPALEGALLLLLEPVLNGLWTWLAHGEVPGLAAACGALTILAATLTYAFSNARAAFRGSS